MEKTKYSWRPCFESKKELAAFKEDAVLLFALMLKFGIEDVVGLASSSITEGSEDKKADLIHIDTESGYAIVAQTYVAKDWDKKEAPANKASDLNTAISWLLNRPLEEIPESIKTHADELRLAIADNKIKTLHIWYVHNLKESKNVKKELVTVEHTARTAITSNFPDIDSLEIQSLEVGCETIENWYISLQRPILVSDKFEIPIDGGYELVGPDWKSFATTIPLRWLYENFSKYKDAIFSANIRGYLGSRIKDDNINYGIKQTGHDYPGHFWVFNNGITALVHNFKASLDKSNKSLWIHGISIVNGAQTTGAIGSLEKKPSSDAKVQVRFIVCNSPSTIQNIVKFNNSQNKITAPDFRSSDPVQTRLVKEFEKLPDLEYLARRGSSIDEKPKKHNTLASITAGQALAAVHGQPGTAYHFKSHIWVENTLYVKYFNEHTTARHLLFAYSLLQGIENKKLELVGKSKIGNLKKTEEEQLKYFRLRGSIILFTSAIANCLETLLDRRIPNTFRMGFKTIKTLDKAVEAWQPIVEISSSFCVHLKDGLSHGLKNNDDISKAVGVFRSLIESTKEANKTTFKGFASKVILL